jgi:hypothetical protein
MAESPTPQLLPATSGDSNHVSGSTTQGDYAQREMPVPQILYAPVPGVSNGVVVNPASIVPPNAATPTTDNK